LSLTGWDLSVFSQFGEDGVIAELLRRVGPPNRYFVEFGAETGLEDNCVPLGVDGLERAVHGGGRRTCAEPPVAILVLPDGFGPSWRR
jgi:hypothetical protein